jgi:spermidine synthase
VGLSISSPLLYLSILVIAVCGIIYELIIGAVSSYLWGDSVFYFSVTIGLYMSAMGLGAFASKFIRSSLFDAFVLSELLIGLVGGGSALFLFWTYTLGDSYEYGMVLVTLLIGALVGIEIPILIRLMEQQETLRRNVAHVLTYDYIGGLIGALLFPLFFLPQLGLIRTALVLGGLNVAIALINFVRHRALLRYAPGLLFAAVCIMGLLSYFLITSQNQQDMLQQKLYRDDVIFSRQTPYQQLTITRWHKDIRLYINGGLQFSSLDEYRYHESLVHVPFAARPKSKNILILGGGDGLAVREVLKYPQVEKIVLVDLDPAMTEIFKTEEFLTQLNQNSLVNPKLTIINQDAYKFAEQDSGLYDIILIDLPDPSHTALAKLYSLEFYHILQKRLSYQGVLVTQSTSPFFATEAFWTIHKTIREAGLSVLPYQVDVPSFGNWGFQMASRQKLDPYQWRLNPSVPRLFLNQETLPALFVFSQDVMLDLNNIQINTLIQPRLLNCYAKGWNGIR